MSSCVVGGRYKPDVVQKSATMQMHSSTATDMVRYDVPIQSS